MAGKKKSEAAKSSLIRALEFLRIAYKEGDEEAQYVRMNENRASSFNRIIACGSPIDEDLSACPELDLLLLALEQSGDRYAITQLPGKLAVRSDGSDGFQAFVPCGNPTALLWPIPDAPVASIDDRVVVAIKKVSGILSTTGETIPEISFQLNHGSAISTDRLVILEAWHGNDLPDGLILPKQFAQALNKAGKKLSQFGFSDATVTFYFEDGTWLRTQRYKSGYVKNIANYLDVEVNYRPVPTELFNAAKKVAPFSTTGYVYVKNGFVSSHPNFEKEQGSVLSLPIGSLEHLPRVYSFSTLKSIAASVVGWDENASQHATSFVGENIRGVIKHEPYPNVPSGLPEDDIPF